jgi:hypothetical protein
LRASCRSSATRTIALDDHRTGLSRRTRTRPR